MRVRPTRFAGLLAILFACTGLGIAVAQGPVEDSTVKDTSAKRPAPAVPDTSAVDPAKGKIVYEKNCTNCHKTDGTGGVKRAPTDKPSRNFRDPLFWKGRTDAQLREAIESGFPKSGMLAYKGVLAPSEIRNVAAYIRARYQPKGVK